jgi:trehalose 6-phosphate phosphatase
LLADPAGGLVACDYDGTLAPIVDDPARAVPVAGAVEALTRLGALVGRVAVVTGRRAVEVLRLGGLDVVPGLVVVGLYGAERWSAGELVSAPPPPGLAAARAAAGALLADPPAPAVRGATLEDKGASFVLHTRRAADPVEAFRVLEDPARAVADAHGLRLEPGRLVLELRAPGLDKGAALTSVALTEPARRSVLFAGDDLGDLAAFAAVRALRDRGVAGWTVASASPEEPRVSADADLSVAGPQGVADLLTALADRLSPA